MKKKLLFSHWTAAKKYSIPYLDVYFAHELALLEERGVEQVIVFDRNERFYNKAYDVHTTTVISQEIACIERNNESIVCIEQVFLQIAQDVDIQRAILLGNLICSKFSGSTPLSSRDALITYIEKCVKHRGRRHALRALQYIKDAYDSPLVMHVDMLLNLPYKLGGYKLGNPKFQHEILIPVEILGESSIVLYHAEIFYPDHDVILDLSSLGEKTNTVNSRELLPKLEELGYSVIKLEEAVLYDIHQLHNLMKYISQVLKKRLRIHTDSFEENRYALHSLLPPRDDTRPEDTETITEQNKIEEADTMQHLLQYYTRINDMKDFTSLPLPR